MSGWTKIAIAALVVAVVAGAIYFSGLRERVLRLARLERPEEQVRREVLQPPIATPTDVKVKAKIFWASPTDPTRLEPAEVELALSADPVQRSKQLINALIANAPAPAQRTLPADATLIEFYLLSDGTGIADFSDTLATATPSGILNEELAVESIMRTLAASQSGVEGARRLKILIRGQETETLAGHLDLTGFFPVQPEAALPAPTVPARRGGKAPAGGLTLPATPGKLSR